MGEVWLVRAGEGNRHAHHFYAGGVVAIGWGDIDGLGDLRTMDDAKIRACLEAAPAILNPGQDLREMLAFRDEMAVGDIVLTPDPGNNDVLVGEITGGYDYVDPSPAGDYHHVRTVKWFGATVRNELDKDQLDDVSYRRTLRRLDAQRWVDVVDAVRAGHVREPGSGRPRAANPAPRARNGHAPLPTRLCPECMEQRALAQFVTGSDWCVDCRLAAGLA